MQEELRIHVPLSVDFRLQKENFGREAEDIKDREIMEKYKGHSNEPMQRNREVTNGEMIQKR